MTDDNLTIGITGATGLLGSHCAKLLSNNGFKVIGLYRNTKPSNLDVEWIEGDILDISLMELFVSKCDIIVHCAAELSHDKRIKNKVFTVNIEGTENIVHAMLDFPDKKLIHISSVSALGRVPETTINERNNWNSELPHTKYGKSKMLSEMVVYKGIAEGLNAMILSPGFIIAYSEDNRSSADIWSQIEKMPKTAPLGGNGYVDVRDAANAVYKAIQNWKSGEKILIIGHNASYKEIYSLASGVPEEKINTPSPLFLKLILPFVKLFYWITGKRTEISNDTIDISSNVYRYDNAKSIKLLQMSYRPLQESIQYILDSKNTSETN